MVKAVQDVKQGAEEQLQRRPGIRDFITKYSKDNIGMLAAYVSWSLLTSLVPIVVGLVAISGLFLRSPSAQQEVVSHLSQALQGALTTSELQNLVRVSVQHTGLLGILGLLGALWGGSNVGGAISTAFQAIFEVGGRPFIKEKVIDIGMILVFTVLLLLILLGTAAGAFLNTLFSGFPLPGVVQFVIGTAIALAAAFLLFASIYLAFPNIQPRLRLSNVWRGALLAAVLFEILSYIWPIYSHFSHFSRYGAAFFSILVLTAWIYFFSMIMMLGAEAVAVGAIHQAQAEKEAVGPSTQDSVPQHEVLRDRPEKERKEKDRQETGRGRAPSAQRSQSQVQRTRTDTGRWYQELSDRQVERDPVFWIFAATPLLVATLAGVYEIVAGEKKAA